MLQWDCKIHTVRIGGIKQMLFLRREDGQGQVEYALLLVLMAIALLVLLTVFGQEIVRVYESIRTELSVLGG